MVEMELIFIATITLKKRARWDYLYRIASQLLCSRATNFGASLHSPTYLLRL